MVLMGSATTACSRSRFVPLKTAFLLSELKFRFGTGWRTNSHGAAALLIAVVKLCPTRAAS